MGKAERLRVSSTGGAGSSKPKPPFSYAACKVRLQLHPSKLNNPLQGVKELLCQYLMRYVDLLGGVVMAFENVRILPESGRIIYDNPYVQYRVAVNFVLFKPSPHVPLDCRVVHQSAAGINLNLFNVFPTKLGADQMAGKLRWHQRRGAWVSRDGANACINGSTIIRLRAIDWKEANNITHFDGRIDEEGLGPLWGEEAFPRPKPKQRRTEEEEQEEVEEAPAPPAKPARGKAKAAAVAAEEEEEEHEAPLAKKKRKRQTEGSAGAEAAPPKHARASAPAVGENSTSEKKKRRKEAAQEEHPEEKTKGKKKRRKEETEQEVEPVPEPEAPAPKKRKTVG